MKKFLALLFVCAGLTAMAAPHVNKADLVQANKGQMVKKATPAATQFTSNVMNMQAKNLTPMKSRFTPNNLVEARKAPRYLSDADMIGMNSVCFLYAYDVMGDEPVAADPFYAGSGAYWYPDASDGLYFAGFYWDESGHTYYLPLDIDYSTGEVALSWGILLKDDTITGNGGRNRVDTIRYEMLVSQAYWDNNEKTDCKGTLYTDGSIIFQDNYVYYTYLKLTEYKNNVAQTPVETETATMFVGTEILTANGELTYTYERDGSAGSSPVYMYQSNDTLFVGNMWNYGVPSSYMVLTADGKAVYPCAEFNPTDSITYLSNPIWDLPDAQLEGGLGMAYPVGSYTLDAEGYIDDFTWGFEANATPDQITWEYTMPSNGYSFWYGFNNNVLKWTNGNQFVLPTPEPQGLRGDVDDNQNVDIQDVTALIDALLSSDWDSINYDNADVDLNGTVTINDVTVLIDFLLNGTWPAAE